MEKDLYTFITYKEFWKDDDRTVYRVGGSNFSGWYRKLLSKEHHLTKEEAIKKENAHPDKDCGYFKEGPNFTENLKKEWMIWS